MERSSYQSNVAPKGVPHLSSVPHAVYTAHLAREESAHRAPQRWAFDDLPSLHMQAQRQGWVSRPVSKGRQRVKAVRAYLCVAAGERDGRVRWRAGGWTAWGERGVWRWWCGGDVGDGGCGMAVEEGVAMVARGARRGGGRGGRGRSAPGRGGGARRRGREGCAP